MIRLLLQATVSLVLLCCSISTHAQAIRLLDISDGRPVEAAFIVDTQGQNGLSTNAEGMADLSSFDRNAMLTITHATYRDTTISRPSALADMLTVYLTPTVITMPTFTLRSNRERYLDVPGQVTKIDAREARLLSPRTTADLLERSGEVFVQRSQVGGGSPVLRGFEANRILLVIDGVRMNNAIYRSGHLQNSISVDPFFIEETEVLFGPGSLIYGSDALGGVIDFHTKTPEVRAAQDFSLSTAFRTATATEETATHFDASVSGKRLAWIGSLTKTSFGDVRMGKNRLHGDDDWGLIPEYVQTIDGRDTVLQNPDPSIDVNSGYSQYDLAQKLVWQASDSVNVLLNVQYSTTTDVPRSDQLTDYRNGRLRYAEWSYGPQERLLTSAQIDVIGDGELHDKAQFILAYQRVGEDRITRDLGASDRFTREEDVDVLSMNVDLVKRLSKKDLYYGVEITDNTVNSRAFIDDMTTGKRSAGPTRYPDGGSKMNTIAAYGDMKFKPSDRLDFDLGLRYTHSYLQARFLDTTFYALPFDEVAFNNGALTGSAGMIWRPADRWRMSFSAATGFRSPNVDDFAKVFERAGIVVVPSDELSPEYTLNGEGRVGYTSTDGVWKSEVGAFYTHILDAIVQRPATLGGRDSLVYEGRLAQIAVNENAQEAYIYGGSAALTIKPHPDWSLSSTVSYTIGRVPSQDQPLAHIPPLFARSDLRYTSDKVTVGTYYLYNAEKKAEDLAPGRTDNADQGIDGGFPAWSMWSIYSDWSIGSGLSTGLTLDNIADVHYRPFASGVSAPGRNLILTVRYDL